MAWKKLVDNPADRGRSLQAVPSRIEELITPPKIVGQGPPPRVPMVPLEELLRELAEDRADR